MSMMEMQAFRSGPVNGAAPPPVSFEAWQALVAPGDVFRHPRDVLAHPGLSEEEKRRILASWASDACALENAPALRCLPGCQAEQVCVDAVLDALAELDFGPAPTKARRTLGALPRRRPGRLPGPRRHNRPGRRDDDDDPPPCPAARMPRPRLPPSLDAKAIALPA